MARCRPHGGSESDDRKPGRTYSESALPTAQPTPAASSPPDLGAALPFPNIKRLVMSTAKQGSVRGERIFRRSLAIVRGLARKVRGSAGYSWTEAAQDGASQLAKRGLEGLLGALEPFLHEGFNRVVAETAEAYLEGLKQQSSVRGRLQGRKRRTSGAKRGAQCGHSKQPRAGLETRPDSHSLSCQACGASAERGLRGGKEGGSIKCSCRAHATSRGCFRVDPDRAVWVADQELRRLRAKARRLEQELRDLGGAAEDASSAPPFAAWQESEKPMDWVSMPKSRSLIATLLLRGGVESNPGPTPQEEKELALKKSWQEVDSEIDSNLLDHLAKQQLTLARWRGMTDDGRSKLLDRLESEYPGPGNWLLGWNAIFDKAAAAARGGGTVGAGPDPGYRTRVKGPQALSDFWLALPQATWSDDERVVTLADGTFFLGQEEFGNQLYRRECYKGLEQEVEQIFAQKDRAEKTIHRAVAIIGNPGIGKTLFGYLLLHQWAKQRRRVIVAKRGYYERAMLLTADGAFKLDDQELEEELTNPSVRFLVDGMDPREVKALQGRAQLVLVTSPDPRIYHETFKPAGFFLRYMDVWEWDELVELWRSIFPRLPMKGVQERYDWWGGIPRYVLEKLDPAYQKLLQQAIDAANLDSLKESAGLSASPSDASHRVLQMRATPDFMECRMVMASVKVSGEVFYRLWEREKDRLRTFLSSAAGELGVETFRGNLFEGFCHRQLAQGGDFDVRDLSDPSSRVEKVKLPPSPAPYVFDSWQEVRNRPDCEYFRPRSKTTEAVDAGMQPDALFQITVSRRHDLKCAGLKKAVDSMKRSGAVKVFFTVPPDAFERFKAVPIGQGTGVASVRQAVKEYALKVGFDHLPA